MYLATLLEMPHTDLSPMLVLLDESGSPGNQLERMPRAAAGWALTILGTLTAGFGGLACSSVRAAESTSRPMYASEYVETYVDAKRYDDALRVLTSPDAYGNPGVDARRARLVLAQRMHYRHQHAAALAMCQEVLSMAPSPAEEGEAQELCADIQIALGHLAPAERLLAQLRSDGAADEKLGSSAWRLGVASLIAHDVKRAAPWLTWVAEASPGFARKEAAVDLLGWMAADHAETGVRGDSPEFLLKLGDLLNEQHEHELAEKAYAAISLRRPTWKPDVLLSKRAFNLLSFATDESAASAKELLIQLVKLHPESPLAPAALFRLHFLYWNYDRDFERAMQSFRQIVKRYPASAEAPDALFRLAAEEMNRGHREEAIGLFVQVLTNYPSSACASGARVNIDRLTGKRSN
jgi:tetratricopeptide (TPR) repeat protein